MKRTYWLILGGVVLVIIVGGITWYIADKGPSESVSTATPTSPTASSTSTVVAAAHITDSNQYYTVDMQYPPKTPLAATAGADADAAAVSAMKAYAQTSHDTFVSEGGLSTMTPETFQFQGGMQEALSDTYELHVGNATISYIFDTYADTGGAHPNSYYKTFTFDSRTGKQLALSDLFLPTANYLGELSTISRAQLPSAENGDTSTDTMMLDGTTPTVINFQNFYIDSGNLVILFDPYQVASYAAGPQSVTIPLSQLNDILKVEYK